MSFLSKVVGLEVADARKVGARATSLEPKFKTHEPRHASRKERHCNDCDHTIRCRNLMHFKGSGPLVGAVPKVWS